MKIPWHKTSLVVRRNEKHKAHCNNCNGELVMVQPIYVVVHDRKKRILARFCSNDCVIKFKEGDKDV